MAVAVGTPIAVLMPATVTALIMPVEMTTLPVVMTKVVTAIGTHRYWAG